MAGDAGGWLVGRNPVLEALRAGRPIDRILLAQGARGAAVDALLDLARGRGVRVERVDASRLERLSPGRPHQGVAALAAPLTYAGLKDVLGSARSRGEPPLLLALDGIQDQGNLGALVRVAEAAGAHGVIIPQRRAAGLGPGAARASAGAVEYLPVARVTNLSRALLELKESGLWVVGADHGAPASLWEADLGGALAVVVGGEGRGLGRLVREMCDLLVRVPMYGRVSSLNAVVAAALVLYEARRRRQPAGGAGPRGGGAGAGPARLYSPA